MLSNWIITLAKGMNSTKFYGLGRGIDGGNDIVSQIKTV